MWASPVSWLEWIERFQTLIVGVLALAVALLTLLPLLRQTKAVWRQVAAQELELALQRTALLKGEYRMIRDLQILLEAPEWAAAGANGYSLLKVHEKSDAEQAALREEWYAGFQEREARWARDLAKLRAAADTPEIAKVVEDMVAPIAERFAECRPRVEECRGKADPSSMNTLWSSGAWMPDLIVEYQMQIARKKLQPIADAVVAKIG